MPIKDILLPLVGQPQAPALSGIEKCVEAASGLGARITALAIEEDVDERPRVRVPCDDSTDQGPASSDAQQLLRAFADSVSRCDIRGESRMGKVPADEIAEFLAEQARFSDLTVFPVKPHHGRTERIIEAFLFGSGRPLLLCPEHLVADLRPELANVMIAWDHSARAARAVNDAMPILEAAASVRVVTVADDKTDTILQSAAALMDHLSEHGVRASFDTVGAQGSSIGKVLGSWANSHGVDVMVMGAYHHSRLNEIVWGGVTKTVIGQPPCWVMISH